jgi:(1->4)-alpha-D-glucan 1-alpha-D-glucosylmutase
VVIAKILQFRRDCPELFTEGEYEALSVSGPRAENICAFLRRRGEQATLVMAARFPAAMEAASEWMGTTIALPDQLVPKRWRDILTGVEPERTDGTLRAESVFAGLPVAVLRQAD